MALANSNWCACWALSTVVLVAGHAMLRSHVVKGHLPSATSGQTSLDHLSRSRPGRAKRTLAMAFFGSMPRSTKSRAAIVPARPSPPRQWTNTSSLRRRIERNSSAATSQACSNFSLELTRQRLEDETTTYFGAIFPRRDLQPLSSITSSGVSRRQSRDHFDRQQSIGSI